MALDRASVRRNFNAVGRRPQPRVLAIGIAAIAVGTCSVALNTKSPMVLWNRSASEPEGLYLRTARPPRTGALAAFHAPGAAFPYADRRLTFLHTVPILKALAAGPGDLVCTRSDVLTIDGRPRAPIVEADPYGASLPHWRACRRLRGGEWFAFSDRVPNSFDSRYYGPIRNGEILAIYRPLWVLERGRAQG
jgi:conjugative transfer signal peptidase TraF